MAMCAEARLQTLATRLVEAGRHFHARGWVPATSGNFSARLDEGRVLITVSGRHKGLLTPADLMFVDLDGGSLSPGCTPSAETLLHTRLYRRAPAIGAVLHTHSANATVLSRLHREALWLADYEVLKAFPGVDTHAARLGVPVFANDQNIARLVDAVDAHLDRHPATPGYLIAGHGLYTWGATVDDALRHIEAFEFLFECETLTRRLASQ